MAFKMEEQSAAYDSPYPPSYNDVTVQHSSIGGGLTFVDFLPQCIRSGAFFRHTEFEPFRGLITCANEWLRHNPSWEVKTCESVEFKAGSSGPKVEQMTYLERGQVVTHFVRCLRLWIVPRSDQSRPPQQLDYINLVPHEVESGGVFSLPKYETLHQMIDRYNSEARFRPAPGRILAVESQEMKATGHSVFDPDRSYWFEGGSVVKRFLFVIRLFFEVGSSSSEAVGVADFCPEEIEPARCCSIPTFENFSSVLAKASQWCAQQSGIRFCNAQSLEIKLHLGRDVDTQQLSYSERSNAPTGYVRVLRVAYTKSIEGYFAEVPRLNLQCKTFVPVQLVQGSRTDFETLAETKRRVEAWVRITALGRSFAPAREMQELFQCPKVAADTSVFAIVRAHWSCDRGIVIEPQHMLNSDLYVFGGFQDI
ncbi:uncharacterized protein LOC135399265 isoform X2 [Ornithodoros turicata]|uniref:uncharacterized protein LOC135399265 isoform X2 n=1 Tax=Ornithodoros turicata TaxID=34597 RepID=UPI00313981C4